MIITTLDAPPPLPLSPPSLTDNVLVVRHINHVYDTYDTEDDEGGESSSNIFVSINGNAYNNTFDYYISVDLNKLLFVNLPSFKTALANLPMEIPISYTHNNTHTSPKPPKLDN